MPTPGCQVQYFWTLAAFGPVGEVGPTAAWAGTWAAMSVLDKPPCQPEVGIPCDWNGDRPKRAWQCPNDFGISEGRLPV